MNPRHMSEHVENMKVASRLLDLTIHIRKAGTLKEALYGIKELAAKNDVVVLQPDPLYASENFFHYAMKESLLQETPLIGISEHQVRHGALMGLAVDYSHLGVQTAKHCNQIMAGKPLASLPIVGPNHYQPLINMKTAAILGISLPAKYLDGTEKIF
jgi:ABC-type uncharacterized transport system substrate-binding protein